MLPSFVSNETVSGCFGGSITQRDHCYDRPPNYLFHISNPLGNNSYRLCEGDFDVDADCTENLTYEEHSGYSEVLR